MCISGFSSCVLEHLTWSQLVCLFFSHAPSLNSLLRFWRPIYSKSCPTAIFALSSEQWCIPGVLLPILPVSLPLFNALGNRVEAFYCWQEKWLYHLVYSVPVHHRKKKQSKNEEDTGYRKWGTEQRKWREIPRMVVKGNQSASCVHQLREWV